MPLNSTDVLLFLGRRGSGKSYLARQFSQAFPRKVIFDTLCEYSASDGVLCSDFDSFAEEILKTQNADSFTIIYQSDPENEDQEDDFNHAMRICWYRGDIFVLIEEVQEFAKTHSMPHWLKKSLLTGRHRNMGLGFTTQRPGECHKTIISQASHVLIGSLHEKNDLEYCKTILNNRVALLQTLPPRTFLYFRPSQPLYRLLENGKLETVPEQS